MRIVAISNHCCVRAVKQAIVVGKSGFDVHLIARLMPDFSSVFTTKTKFDSKDQLVGAIRLFNDKDIFHVHNEPSWYVSLVKEIYPKAKVIYDVHDSNYWRIEGDFSWYEDDVASQLCDAYVFPGKSLQKKYPALDKPQVVIPSANPATEFIYGPWHYVGGLVSQGGHVSMKRESTDLEAWRDYSELYTALKGKKLVAAYSPQFKKGDKELDEYYKETGANLKATDHSRLLQKMGCFDWSLCGNLGDAPVWKLALPNKFYDSMAGGVPVLNLNVPAVAEIIDKYDVGINVSSVEEMLEVWSKHIEKRGKVLLNRKYLSMECFIKPLLELYKSLGTVHK